MPEDPLAVDMADISVRMPASVVRGLSTNLRAAGVLIPIIERPEALRVLLTERSADLRHHAGQVSFPGGGMEAHDVDIIATALREAREEVGIQPHEVDIAGFLNPTPTITGFAVTPIVGLVRETFTLKVDPMEVERVFEVPLDFLMDYRNEEHSERDFQGTTIPVVTFHYDGHRIWGATASMLITLRQLLTQ
jgi:8-oxo-dGTP pyrophosphatase MutT (NUDIX family)